MSADNNTNDSSQRVETNWSVAIFSSRESIDTLSSSIDATLAAITEAPVVVDIIINGNRELADKVGQYIQALRKVKTDNAPQLLRVWHIEVANKAHAWNVYIHDICPPSEIAFFLDGYIHVEPDSLAKIAAGLRATPEALAASGIPTTGRSAKRYRELFIRERWLSGNCYALRGEVLKRLRDRGIRLPLGIYRNDGLIESGICFNLDPSVNRWNKKRLLVLPDVTWSRRPLAWWRVTDLRQHWKRMFRQAQGVLEQRAVRWALSDQKRTLESLPQTISELIREWIDARPSEARKVLIRNPLCFFAAKRLLSTCNLRSKTLPSAILIDRLELAVYH